MKAWFLRLHRWITLATVIPLAIVIVTGGLLSLEPILFSRSAGTVSLAKVEAMLAKHDPDGKAGALRINAYEGTLNLSAGRGAPPTMIDIASGEKLAPGQRLWSDFFTSTRRMHESLLIDQKWIVDYSTIAMIVSMIFGLLMGWPRFRNSMGGWHRTVAFVTAPLLILSALSGLAIAWGITFITPPAAPAGGSSGAPRETVTLREAVKVIAAKHDLASVIWIRPQGGALRARVYNEGHAGVFTVTKQGLVEGPRNWPRVWHEGVWAGAWSGLLNLGISVVLLGLLITGMTIWARRTFRSRTRNRAQPA
jgi:uncharacterized iron-regulated membrane protein